MPARSHLTLRLRRLTEDEILKWTKSSSSSKHTTIRKSRKDDKKTLPKSISCCKNPIKPIASVEGILGLAKQVLKKGTCPSELQLSQGDLLEDIDIKNEPIEVEEEKEGAERAEILDLLDHTFLCTICGNTHSKNFACGNLKSEVFPCSNQDCGKTFESELELEQHADSCQVTDPLLINTANFQDEDSYPKTGRKPQCRHCGKFVKKMINHVSKFHPKEVVQCSIANCRKRFVTEKGFSDHVLQFHSPIKCAFCNEVFEKNTLYIKHFFRKHMSKGCIKCTFTGCIHFFKSYPEMEKHYKETHFFKAKCDLCGFLAPTLTVLLHHMNRTHYPAFEKRSERTECSYCGKFVKRIDIHLRKVHSLKNLKRRGTSSCHNIDPNVPLQNYRPPALKALKCFICDLVFEKKYVYIQHVRNSHQGHKLFKCSFKGCIHFFKSHLEMEKHYREKHPFQGKCDLCGYLAPSLKVLLNHMNKSHYPKFEMKKINAKKTKCSYCGKFISKIKEHLSAIHPEKSLEHPGTGVPDVTLRRHTPLAPRAIICVFCDLVFDKNHVYVRHVRDKHQGNKLFKCSLTGCVLYFNNYSEMKNHYKENHPLGARCDQCGHLAPTMIEMSQHIKRRHDPKIESKKKKCKCSLCGDFVIRIKDHFSLIHPAENML